MASYQYYHTSTRTTYGTNPNANHSTGYQAVTTRLCGYSARGTPCRRCVYEVYSQSLLRRITFRQLIGIMSSLLKEVMHVKSSTINYSQCTIRCDATTRCAPKIVDKDVKVLCDVAVCKFMAYEWLGYNGLDRVGPDTVSTLTDIIDNTTTTEGLVTSLDLLYQRYDQWQV